ncbi:LCP family protein [Serinibacter salmoneus]|uniref:LytR family transcriptional attenuator n=1 Tax=Serinibacter salmoneus TaxID=556530 RepID=A0A2A9CYJ2_9MICO|nr:LCP family protein [Serinibacter salmoneus]PFG18649.1 LytR family transcriptional attenuator [Serinibacter salmoneus]
MTRERRFTGRVRTLAAAVLTSILALAACTAAPQAEVTRAPSTIPSAVPSATETTTTPSSSPSPTPSPTPSSPLGEGAVNALLIGTDSRTKGDLTGNADTIMLAHLPADREALYLISFTRDMWVEIPGLGEGKINAAFARGGTQTLVDTVSQMLGGVEVDYVAQSNFDGFIALTRALEGIPVQNKHHSTVTVLSTGRVVDFPEGEIVLENTDGLIYVRERKRLPLGDLDRTERQRAVIVGMLDKIASFADDPAKLAEVLAYVVGNVKITGDLDLTDVTALVPLAGELTREDVVGLMVPITGFGTIDGASVNLVDQAQTAALGEAIREDDLAGYVATYGTDYAP